MVVGSGALAEITGPQRRPKPALRAAGTLAQSRLVEQAVEVLFATLHVHRNGSQPAAKLAIRNACIGSHTAIALQHAAVSRQRSVHIWHGLTLGPAG